MQASHRMRSSCKHHWVTQFKLSILRHTRRQLLFVRLVLYIQYLVQFRCNSLSFILPPPPWTACPPGGKISRVILPPPHPGYLHPPGGKLSRPVYLAPPPPTRPPKIRFFFFLILYFFCLLNNKNSISFYSHLKNLNFGAKDLLGASCPGRFILPPS